MGAPERGKIDKDIVWRSKYDIQAIPVMIKKMCFYKNLPAKNRAK